MKELHTEIEIDAPAERVWELLTDFATYPQWNPFIRNISGLPVPGERLQVRPLWSIGLSRGGATLRPAGC